MSTTNPDSTGKKASSQQTDPNCTLRRRNVNWDPQVSSSTSRTKNEDRSSVDAPVDDDGFESLNGKSSGGEDSSNPGIPSAAYFKKIMYTNTWSSACPQQEKETKSDSDTDTLRNTPTSQEQTCGVLPTMQAGKSRRHLSSESGIELQLHKRKSILDEDHIQRITIGQSEPKDDGFDKTLESSGDTDEENDSDLHHNDSSHHPHHHLHHHHSHHHHHQHLSEGTDTHPGRNLANTDSEYLNANIVHFITRYFYVFYIIWMANATIMAPHFDYVINLH